MPRELLAGLKAIEHFASVDPQVPALLATDGTVVAYAELRRQTTAMGRRLSQCGIGPQEIVAVLAPQGMYQAVSVLGVLSYCACAALQPRTVPDEVKTALRRLSASALIVSPEFTAEAEAALDAGLLVLTGCIGQPPEEWQIEQPSRRLQPSVATADAVLYQLTSATMGASRIVPTSFAACNARVLPIAAALKLTALDRQLQMTSFSHGMAVFNTCAQLVAGGSVIVTEGFDPAAYRRWIEELRPTWYACSPTVHKAALEQLKDAQPQFSSSLRLVLSTGAALPQETQTALEQALQVPVFNDYGSTEAGFIATEALTVGDRVDGSAGRSYISEIGIMGSSGEMLPAGEDGEIVLRGEAIFSAYLDDEPASQAAFRNGWMRTGDAGRLDADGNLFVTGRIKELINRGGEKISPSEVDTAIGAHPAVLEATAFAVPHPTLGEDVACAVVLRNSTGPSPTAGDLRRFAAERLARFKIPSRIYFVDEIPRGDLNKPQRWLLAERLVKSRIDAPSPTEVTKHAKEDYVLRLQEIWARLLDRDDLGLEEDFFSAGGDSLAAINMLAEVDRRLGSQASASAASFLEEPTLAHLAELVGKAPPPRPGQAESSEMRVFPAGHEGAERRLFCIPADGEEGLNFRRLATHLRGQMDVSIVRPANTWYRWSLFTFEQAGAMAAKAIRQAQPEGPYLVAGFCFGGIVAVEAVRQLIRDGQEAGLILFDVPTPGFPSPFSGWRTWVESARREWQERRHGNNTNFALNPRYVARRMAWHALLPFRRPLAPAERIRLVKWFIGWTQTDYFPPYKAQPMEAPILQFVCSEIPNVVDRAARFGWRTMAGGGIEEHFVAFDHANTLHESNLPNIVDALLQWADSLRFHSEVAVR